MRANYLFLATCIAVACGLVYLSSRSSSNASDDSHPLASSAKVAGHGDEGIEARLEPETALATAPKAGAYALGESDRVPLPEGRIDEVVQRLTPRAEAGDAEAALALYRKLDHCFSTIRSSPSADEIAIYMSMGAGQQLEDATATSQKDCTSEAPIDYQQRGRWLELAADAGSTEAKLLYAIDSSAFFDSPSQMMSDPKKLERYRRKSTDYMTQLAASGNIDSMLWMARSHSNGIMAEHNPVRAYAYYRTAQMASSAVVPQELIMTARTQLSAKQISQGEVIARELYKRCCS